MTGEILTEKICRFIAQCYALNGDDVVEKFKTVNSLDVILDMAKEGKLDT